MMSRNDVLEVLEHLAGHDIDVWVDGGWGIDALVGSQTRPHGDLDLSSPRATYRARKQRSPARGSNGLRT
jgi:lincosamide nucleotidyltransferase A/C/D/E